MIPMAGSKCQVFEGQGREEGGTPGPKLEALPLSLLNDLLYCPRRAALEAGENGLRPL
jgi:hypothetical protein